ncbi:uncharacterized protein At3g27210-like [Diospyros lotus]|uniref:uncharacterized protein At3g27210-like n=1 Tax=Diospyros lotus TaxID=55363 RepID=UPI002250DA7A|nr:uncharacterized protein At3g27210-like [Diospyros lotus]
MGTCASNMKHRLSFDSKPDNVVTPSPIKDKMLLSGHRPGGGGVTVPVRDFGGKEETFFDSQPWLESDCEDDFFSVKGDFTPSCGSTPVHWSSTAGSPRVDRGLFGDKKPVSTLEPSPTDKKKKLAELFREGLKGDQDADQNGANVMGEAKTTIIGLPPRSADGTPFVSGAASACSNEIPDGVCEPDKSVQCCLPRMHLSRSLSERKKKTRPPTGSIG